MTEETFINSMNGGDTPFLLSKVQIQRGEKREREVAKATAERVGLPVAHKMQRL
jgi:hypothetical protein